MTYRYKDNKYNFKEFKKILFLIKNIKYIKYCIKIKKKIIISYLKSLKNQAKPEAPFGTNRRKPRCQTEGLMQSTSTLYSPTQKITHQTRSHRWTSVFGFE